MSDVVNTRDTSQTVADALKYLIEHPSDKRHIALHLVRYKRRSGSELPKKEEFSVAIRLLDELPNIIPRAGGGEIARCITREGKRVDIIFGNPARRGFEPANIDLEE